MIRSDYKCQDCYKIFEKTFEKELPYQIECENCGGLCLKKFTPLPAIVHQGRAGNYNNGYASSPVAIKKT